MSRETNFLLGQGERLTSKVKIAKASGDKNPPYDFDTARDRLSSTLGHVTKELDLIPADACPKDEVVALVTMHPRYLSKSDFPEELLKSVGLRSIGSRSSSIKPEQWGTKKHPDGQVTTEQVFVAGTKKAYKLWAEQIGGWQDGQTSTSQITRVEKVSAYEAKEKIKSLPMDRDEATFEVVIHNSSDKTIIDAFEAYAGKIDSKPAMDRKRDIGGLTFIPVKAPVSRAVDLAQFSFLRVLRGMPTIRPIPVNLVRAVAQSLVNLPTTPSINENINAAIFDGGMIHGLGLDKWVTTIEPNGIGKASPIYVNHGLAVTSAFLFGHITNGIMPSPFCKVDHIRVLDENTGKNATDFEILDVLDRIINHLSNNKNKYHFVNLSLGPDLATTDDEVTLWTASLDQHLSKEDILTTVAVGYNGHLDPNTGLNRIQVPSDAVNALSVGACNSQSASWGKADYSGIGPGRRPGVVKPDGLAFGGSDTEPFMVLSPNSQPSIIGITGTSFASPLALRAASGVKSYIGDDISPRAIRALMIHKADCKGLSRLHVGWGKFETDVGQLITCDNDEALVIYQGELPVGEHLRAFVPIPNNIELKGKVNISATLVIAPEVDPEHPGAYTRAGLEVAFRPHSDKYGKPKDGKTPKNPKTKSFFSEKNMYNKGEYDFREDGSKWEPCLKNTQRFNPSSLKQPCFDIYYHHRSGGAASQDPKPIKYALVVSIKAPKVKDFYNQVVRAYANVLVPLRPKIEVQVAI